MKRLLQVLSAMVLVLGLPAGYAHEYPTNWQDFTNYFPSINAKADLGALLNYNTNEDVTSDFDRQIVKSLPITSKASTLVSICEISFIFHYRTEKECLESSQEMAGPINLICQDGTITRANGTDKVPCNFISVVDSNVKNVTAEIDLFLGVAPVKKPQDVKYFRRTFRFVNRNGWVKD